MKEMDYSSEYFTTQYDMNIIKNSIQILFNKYMILKYKDKRKYF